MNSHRTSIGFATLADVVEIGELSRKYIEHDLVWHYTPEKLARLLKSEIKNVVVSRIGDQLVGFGIMTYSEEQANLDLLAVKPGYRNQGIGRQIVSWLEEVALTAGIATVDVQVRKTNTGAITFYKLLGYKILDEKRGYYQGREAGVMMSKDIRKITIAK